MQGVLEVVDGVGHVVGPVHDLLLQAGALPRRALAEPVEDLGVVGVVAELVRLPAQIGTPAVIDACGITTRPGVLAGGVERRPGEIEAGTATGRGVDDLGLQARHHAQCLRIALEATDALGEAIELALPVVAEGRMPEVVGQSGDVDQVGIAPERRSHLARDLGDLQGVRQAGAREVRAARDEDLGGRRQAAQPGRVQHPRAVPGEGRAIAGHIEHPPLDIGGGVARGHAHAPDPSRRVSPVRSRQRLSEPPAPSEARPASSRATGTRNGEHET